MQIQLRNDLVNCVKSTRNNLEIASKLLIVEHEPVYTIGIRSKEYSTELEEKLKSLGADFVRTNRGGLITFHGHGQLVGYPVLYLGNFQKSIKWYIHQIESTIIKMTINILNDYSLIKKVSTLDEYPGVWINEDKKIAAIGVNASQYVTMHGFAINCNTDLKWFDHIVPCGIKDKSVTSLSKELNTEFTIEKASPYLLSSFAQNFNCDLI